jgi:hypothetical protein
MVFIFCQAISATINTNMVVYEYIGAGAMGANLIKPASLTAHAFLHINNIQIRFQNLINALTFFQLT